ncbi:unnamed protein product [Vitrella brassicaformis CCMP3155]|uniref:Uncharacterized protein n=1 Tax=Vitrella brassicaformis (strain CCMP3155) TaxID=1169540 RepID=A0A0G4H854_VITBC|nr:unnamed protein product [Vitrella brassicaformis CCMP3155]|eukprot:CEM40088.1 unnamed protein product [Vitrella brassicaformis CCMP3155]
MNRRVCGVEIYTAGPICAISVCGSATGAGGQRSQRFHGGGGLHMLAMALLGIGSTATSLTSNPPGREPQPSGHIILLRRSLQCE